jgi:hypothetical protein
VWRKFEVVIATCGRHDRHKPISNHISEAIAKRGRISTGDSSLHVGFDLDSLRRLVQLSPPTGAAV